MSARSASAYPNMPISGLAVPGEFVKLVPEPGDRQKPYFVHLGDREIQTIYVFGKTAVENQSFGQIASGNDKDRVEILDMQPNKDHIYQMRFGVRGPVQMYLNVPTTREIGGLDNQPALGSGYRDLGYYDQFMHPVYKLNPMTERWYNYDYYPSFKLYNPANTPHSPEIVFRGAMFEFKLVEDQEILRLLNEGRISFRYANLSGIHHTKPS